jgi:hypothetical protein
MAVAAAATLLSLGMAAWPDAAGAFQRIMFLMAFGWLVWVTRGAYPLTDGRP